MKEIIRGEGELTEIRYLKDRLAIKDCFLEHMAMQRNS